ncbi:MAG: alpha/beta hydrolase [Anaerolineales bacterium]|nr:alpha/beta hydrolase [Anaerolineales bacterium]
MWTETQEYEFHSQPFGSENVGPVQRWVQVGSGESKLRLHTRAWEGQKQPFVLLHGLASNARTWDGVAQVLARHGHPVLAVDQRGHGLSDKPATGYDFASVSDDLASLLDALHLNQPMVAGQSWGGNVLLDFGARYPGHAAGLIFVDGGYIDLQSRPDGEWEKVAEQLRPPDWLGVQRAFLAERIRLMHSDWTEAGIEATLGKLRNAAGWKCAAMAVA